MMLQWMRIALMFVVLIVKDFTFSVTLFDSLLNLFVQTLQSTKQNWLSLVVKDE